MKNSKKRLMSALLAVVICLSSLLMVNVSADTLPAWATPDEVYQSRANVLEVIPEDGYLGASSGIVYLSTSEINALTSYTFSGKLKTTGRAQEVPWCNVAILVKGESSGNAVGLDLRAGMGTNTIQLYKGLAGTWTSGSFPRMVTDDVISYDDNQVSNEISFAIKVDGNTVSVSINGKDYSTTATIPAQADCDERDGISFNPQALPTVVGFATFNGASFIASDLSLTAKNSDVNLLNSIDSCAFDGTDNLAIKCAGLMNGSNENAENIHKYFWNNPNPVQPDQEELPDQPEVNAPQGYEKYKNVLSLTSEDGKAIFPALNGHVYLQNDQIKALENYTFKGRFKTLKRNSTQQPWCNNGIVLKAADDKCIYIDLRGDGNNGVLLVYQLGGWMQDFGLIAGACVEYPAEESNVSCVVDFTLTIKDGKISGEVNGNKFTEDYTIPTEYTKQGTVLTELGNPAEWPCGVGIYSSQGTHFVAWNLSLIEDGKTENLLDEIPSCTAGCKDSQVFAYFPDDTEKIAKVEFWQNSNYDPNEDPDKEPEVDDSKDLLIENNTNVYVTADKGVLPKNVKLAVYNITSGDALEDAKKAVANQGGRLLSMYDISLVNDAYEKRQPSGNVMVGIPNPDGLSSNFAIYALEEDGSATDLNAFLTEDGKTLCYYTSNLTAVAIADVVGAPISDYDDPNKNVQDDNDVNDDNAKTGVNDVLPVILVFTFAAVLVLRMKKKSAQK